MESDAETDGFDMKDLFGEEKFDWEKEWNGMPEFVQDDLQLIHHVMVGFETVEDMKNFSQLVGRNIKFTTKSIVYPLKTNVEKKVWVDES
tara:strand:+ start:1584 stop:1853 length:270 start_codon:yes stop_codon:yes gene_type:complete